MLLGTQVGRHLEGNQNKQNSEKPFNSHYIVPIVEKGLEIVSGHPSQANTKQLHWANRLLVAPSQMEKAGGASALPPLSLITLGAS